MTTDMPAPRAGRGQAPISGALATAAGLGAGHLVAVVAPGSSPVVAVASRAIDLTPRPVKDWAVATFGTGDKAVLVTGAVIVTLALGALVGVIAQRTLRTALLAGALLVVVAMVAAGADPGRAAFWWLPGLVALVVGGFALTRLLRASRDDADLVGSGRRAWFRLALATGGLGALGAVLGQVLRPAAAPAQVTLPERSVTPFPGGLEAQAPGLSPFVTPASEFYRIDTALVPPGLDASTWRLSIKGMVDHPYEIGWDELIGMDAIERPVTLACVSNEVGGDLIGSARWLGVRTSVLLGRAAVQSGADMVLSTSSDGFTVSTPLQALLDGRDALVAYGMNGAVLPREHGYPVRLLTPGLYGFVGATKWLVTMEVTTFAAHQAYWTVRGWSDHGPIKPGSRIELPRPGVRVTAGQVKVGGTAWAHGVGVGAVQVRVDGGAWSEVTLGPDGGVEYWRQWLWTWDATPGEHQLQVRVVDAAGKPQDESVVGPFPNGASGLHAITVTVA